MKIPVRRSCLSLIVLSALVEVLTANENETSTAEGRRGRVSGRIVKLYSGYKPDPVLCLEEGFKADPVQCSIFYRCLKSSTGRFSIFKFQCGPGTVYDPETEVCNHPSSTKRSECGGIKSNIEENENDIEQHELPSPISTIAPVYTSAAHNIPSISSDIFLPSIENTYINSLTPSSSSYHIGSATKEVQYNNQNFVTQPWINYENTTQKKIISSTTIFPMLEKRQPCTSDGFMGDRENCKKFYRCVSNLKGGFIRYEFLCSEPTVWDDHMQSCNHPWAVRSRRCGRYNTFNRNYTQIPTEQTDTSYGVKITENPNQQSNFIGVEKQPLTNYGNISNTVQEYSPEKNHNYYGSLFANYPAMQINNKNVGSKENIDEINNNSNYGQKTTVQTSYSTNSVTQLIEISQRIICTQSGFVGDSIDCKKFYRCVENGKGSFAKYEFTCGQGTVWDKKLEACNYAWAVKECGGAGDSSMTADSLESSSSSILSENLDNGYINHSSQEYEPSSLTDSTRISESTIKTPTTQSFTQSTTPDKLPNYNEYNEVYGSQLNAATPNPELDLHETTSTTIINQNNDCESTGFRGDTKDCKKFYRCVSNGERNFIRYEFSCSEGTVWDPEIEACNHAWAVKHCGNGKPQKEQVKPGLTDNTYSSTNPDDLGVTTAISFTQTSTPQKEISDYDSGYGQPISISTNKPNINLEMSTLKQTSGPKKYCQASGFMGDINNCKKFYRCVDNGNGGFIQYEFSCGDGTVWDSTIEACNHAGAVNHCGSSMSSTENVLSSSTTNVIELNDGDVSNNYIDSHNTAENLAETTILPSSTTISTTVTYTSNECKSSGFMGDNKDCKKFYRCVDDGKGGFLKHMFMCGEGTVWDSKIVACNHKWAVEKCGGDAYNENIESTTHSTTSIMTVHTTTIRSTLSASYPPSSTSSTTTTKTSINPLPTLEANDCNSEGYFANPNDCKRFYRCVNDGKDGYTKYDFSCAEGTAWDIKIQACNYISEVEGCQPNKHPIDITETKPIHDEQMSESDTSKSTTPASTTSAFTTSASTTAASTTSASTTLASTTSASSTSTTSSATSASSPSPSTTLASTTSAHEAGHPKPAVENTCTDEGYFGNSNDCKKFYRCVYENDGYTKYDFICAEGTIWDQDIITCNHPRDVKKPSCKATPENTSAMSTTSSTSKTTTTENNETPSSVTTDTSEKPSISEVVTNKNDTNLNCSTSENLNSKNYTCSKAGFYADPSNCKKFYRCVDWENNGQKYSIYHFECADGTIWDPALETCNHEESVYPPRNCNNAQQQNENTTGTSSTTEQITPTTQQTQSITTSSKPTKTTTQSITTSDYSSTQSTQSSTNEESTTQSSSTTEVSTTQQSTTEESTTQTSTSQSSTTQESTTEESTTQTTTTQSSTTEDSTTQTSTTPSSTTEESTTQTTTTQSSTTEDSTTQTSTTQLSTTEESTTQTSITQSSTSGESTTQSSTMQSSTSEESTTQSSTTEESTTQLSTTKEQTTGESTTSTTSEQTTTTQLTSTTDQTSTTTELSTTSASTTENNPESTTESSTKKECPETSDDQSLYVCPTSFKRHPKYCNLFYQCTEDNDSHELKIAVFKCPNNTIYDENKIQCLAENQSSKKCNGEISQKNTVKKRGTTQNEPFVVTKERMACRNSGHFPFEKHTECSPSLLKCELTKYGLLQGVVYRCPDGFVYWNISRRCEPIRKVRDCKRSSYPWTKRYDIPLERFNIAP